MVVAVDANSQTIPGFQFFKGDDGGHLNMIFWYFLLVEEEITFVVAEGVVGFADDLFVGVILGNNSDIDGVLGSHSQYLDLEITEAMVVL